MSRQLYDIDPLLPFIRSGYVLLTPNFRLARRIQAEWETHRTTQGASVWEPLPVQPLEDWLMAQWRHAVERGLLAALVPLSPALQSQVWQQVIAREERQNGQYHLLRPAAAAEMASQARENILRWQVDTADEAMRQVFDLDTDCATFLRWCDGFERRLADAKQTTNTDCIRSLYHCAAELAPSRAMLVEFDDIPPLHRATLAELCEDVLEHHPDGHGGDCQVHVFVDKRAELQAVARWAHSTSQLEPEASIGVMLSDTAGDRTSLEYLLRREFDCLGKNYNALPVNFSTGIALDRAPVVRDALKALATGLQQIRVHEVVDLLQSRFLQLPDADSALATRFVTRLYDDGRETLELAALRHAACEVKLGEHKGLALGRHLLSMFQMRELRQSLLPGEWVEKFCQVLALWGWPGPGPLDSLEYQQVELWYQTLDEFRGYDGVCSAMNYSGALNLLKQSCAAKMSQPRTEDSRIQVLGPLEAAGLSFDHLWLCGMQGSRWPAPARPNPFIPVFLQRQRQMPHADAAREWDYSARLFDQYTRSASYLNASYSEQVDGIPEIPSAFLNDYKPSPGQAPSTVDVSWSTRCAARDPEFLSDHQAPPVEPQRQRDMRGGSGLLEDQSQCPFRAFARRRLLVQPLSDFSVALSAAERGSLLHDALFVLWGEVCDHATLLRQGVEEDSRVVQAAVQSAIESIPGGRRRLLGQAYWKLEAQRLSALLDEWLAVERRRGEFVVYQREQDIGLELECLQINLRVDRIDELPDGSHLIIDYKSGSSKVLDWLGERPARPQLLLYGIAAPDSLGALSFAQLRPRDCRFVGLGRSDGVPGIETDIGKVVKDRMDANDWASLNERWRENLERLAKEFVRGDARVDPLGPASCTWCGLQPLCRIGLDEEVAR